MTDGQRQSGGDDSFNVQAGNDVVINQGGNFSMDEARTYMLGLFHENFMQLQGVARQTAEERVDELTETLLAKVYSANLDSASAFELPALQQAVYKAQAGYAVSGEEELAETLTDLLIDRAKEPERNLRALALEEAVSVAGRLTHTQRAASGFSFAMRYLVARTDSREAHVRSRIEGDLLPMFDAIRDLRKVDLQHLQFLGVGTVEMGQVAFARCFRARAVFSNGFTTDDLPETLQHRSGLMVNHPYEPDLLQFHPTIVDTIDSNSEALPDIRTEMLEVIDRTSMTDEETLEWCRSQVPQLAEMEELWNESELRAFTLTSVGFALGHSYWSHASEHSAPLQIWL